MELNKFQTPITDELIASLTKEEQDSFYDYIHNVEFIRRCISADRKHAKDLPKNENGRIIIDICNPHILENMEYFRPAGNHYKQHGVYTKLRPNGNPNSEFGRFLQTELDRCWEGYTRESDGEWIPGELYFYWNYTPILLSEVIEGTSQADRVEDFPNIWESTYIWAHYMEQAKRGGIYNDFKGGEDAVVIARRGVGKSYFMASVLARIFTIGASKKVRKKVKGLVVAYEKEYLTKDGILNKYVGMIDFLSNNTQFPSARIKNSIGEMSWKMGYVDATGGTERGTLNEVLGLSARDNPDKVRGKRSHEVIYEEFGSFPKFIETWITSEYNVREGDISFGRRMAIGTGGTEGADFSGALELIYNPKGYHVYGLTNVFDKNTRGKNTTVLFLGAYLNRKGFYNEDGVSDIVGAIISELKARTIIKYNSGDPMSLTRRKAEMPITLQEAIMRRDSTLYPVADITDVINEIDLNSRHWDNMWIGKLTLSNGEVHWAPDVETNVIKDFPHKDNKLDGAICIHKMPQTDSSGRVPWGRYIAGIDPYDDDSSTTMSLGSLYILDLWTDELVFEYTGRPTFADDFYENCRRALIMYNAECNYENNKKGLFTYFSKHNALYLLADTLEFLRDKEMVKGALYGNKAKGLNATDPINAYARRCIRDWLLKPIIEYQTEEINGDIVQNEIIKKNLTRIPFKALLRELSQWNPDGNFDRHDALGMLMLIREDKLRLIGEKSPSEAAAEREADYLGDDDFFKNNYGISKLDSYYNRMSNQVLQS